MIEAGALDPADAAAVIRLGRELLSGWRSAAARGEFPLKRGIKKGQLAVVYGLTAHTHRVAEPALDLLERGLVAETWPLVRTAYECAITAMWAAQTSDGSAALLNDAHRQHGALSRNMRQGSAFFRESAASVAPSSEPLLDTTSMAGGRHFEQRCNDLSPGGADAYVIFRLMSEYAHATAGTLDQYVSLPESGDGFVMHMEAQDSAAASPSFFVAASLAWAGRAVDYFDRTHFRRSELRATARQLEIPLDLKLSAGAYSRQQSTRKAARQP